MSGHKKRMTFNKSWNYAICWFGACRTCLNQQSNGSLHNIRNYIIVLNTGYCLQGWISSITNSNIFSEHFYFTGLSLPYSVVTWLTWYLLSFLKINFSCAHLGCQLSQICNYHFSEIIMISIFNVYLLESMKYGWDLSSLRDENFPDPAQAKAGKKQKLEWSWWLQRPSFLSSSQGHSTVPASANSQSNLPNFLLGHFTPGDSVSAPSNSPVRLPFYPHAVCCLRIPWKYGGQRHCLAQPGWRI